MLSTLMPLSSIVVIVVRLFVLNWVLHALNLAAGVFASQRPPQHSVGSVLVLYSPAVFLIIVGAILWRLAPAVARLVSRGFDSTVSVGSLSRADLYSFGFVFLGLFFILSSIADVINWFHYFTVAPDDPRRDPQIQDFYGLTRPCLTLAAGLVSLLGAPRWTKKLLSHDEKRQRPDQALQPAKKVTSGE
jgi:hypothetical protein